MSIRWILVLTRWTMMCSTRSRIMAMFPFGNCRQMGANIAIVSIKHSCPTVCNCCSPIHRRSSSRHTPRCTFSCLPAAIRIEKACCCAITPSHPSAQRQSITSISRECSSHAPSIRCDRGHPWSIHSCSAMSARFGVVLLLCLLGCRAEEITKLPGVNFDLVFKHYSGFFQVSDNHILHYWFVESQNSPANDPLIFWFNGGPGCSSLDGLLNEMGPYVANDDGKTLRRNEWSWNKLASVVYIESPAGVGYSYATDGNITTNDDLTSLENYEAVKQFFTEFPQFRHNPTYIMGESYGGVYVPTLTARIVDGQKDFPINLKGMALGNGYVDETLNIDTSVRYAYGHGLIDEKIWNTLERDCCSGCIDSCDLTDVSGHCATMVEEIFQFLWFGGLNPYDLYRDCDPNPARNSKRFRHVMRGVTPNKMKVFDEMFRNKTKASLKQMLEKRQLHADVPCLNDTEMVTYMNDPKVRSALHIPFNLAKWDICSDKVTTTYQKQYTDMAPFVRKIVKSNVKVLLYYGDTDMACNFMMGQQFADRLGLRRTLKKTPWKYDRQIAGFKTLFDGLTFLTIRGAGHMAPQWRAPQMYYAIQQFLLNHPI